MIVVTQPRPEPVNPEAAVLARERDRAVVPEDGEDVRVINNHVSKESQQ